MIAFGWSTRYRSIRPGKGIARKLGAGRSLAISSVHVDRARVTIPKLMSPLCAAMTGSHCWIW